MASKKEGIKLTDLQNDALLELSNITSGNATTALSRILDREVKISIPDAEFISVGDLTKKMGGPKKMVMAIFFNVHGDLSGQALFLFQRSSAMLLIDLLLDKKTDTTIVLDDMAKSAFGEMANIFTGSYISSLSDFLGLNILPGIPVIASDYVGPILEYGWKKIENPQKKTLCFSTKVMVDKKRIEGDFVFMFEEKSYKNLLDRLEEKFGVKGMIR